MDTKYEQIPSSKVSLIARLLDAGEIDTNYRDLYVERGLNLMENFLPRQGYARLQTLNAEIDDALRQLAPAVERQEWGKVKALTARIAPLRQEMEANRALLDVGARIYEPVGINLDPFCPALQSIIPKHEPSRRRDALLATLAVLEEKDSLWRDFYTRRHSFIGSKLLPAAEEEISVVAATDPAQVQRQARAALNNRDLDVLERLADEMLQLKRKTRLFSSKIQSIVSNDSPYVFSEETLKGARKLKLVPAEVEPAPELGDYLQCCCAWQAILPDEPLTAGQKPMNGCTCAHVCLFDLPVDLKSTLDLLMLNPFVDSGGRRYLPRFLTEQVLVESFSEEANGTLSELLAALGLAGRTALSRLEIDQALLQRGPSVVRNELHLDPEQFRIVCIPFDIYARLASIHGWGKRNLWTHFDGYQLWKGNRLRALVGGDVRFGGRYDLCSISLADKRDNVTARFAVVRRERAASI